MFGLLDAIKIGAATLAGALIGGLLVFGYVSIFTIPAAHHAGQTEERIIWQERQARLEAKAEADRKASQSAIDAVEADYLRRDALRTAQMTALEQALEQDQNNVPIPSPLHGGAAACRPAVTRGLSQRLNDVGRAAPGVDPASPHAAVP